MVNEKLEQGWSPEQISGYGKREGLFRVIPARYQKSLLDFKKWLMEENDNQAFSAILLHNEFEMELVDYFFEAMESGFNPQLPTLLNTDGELGDAKWLILLALLTINGAALANTHRYQYGMALIARQFSARIHLQLVSKIAGLAITAQKIF